MIFVMGSFVVGMEFAKHIIQYCSEQSQLPTLVNSNTQISNAIVNSIQTTINDTLISYSQSCTNLQGIKQSIIINNINNSHDIDISQDSTTSLSLTCIQQNATDTSLANSMKDALTNTVKQEAKAQGTSALLNNNVEISTQVSNNIQTIVNQTSVSNIMNCMASLAQEQDVTINNINNSSAININQFATSDASLNCIQKNATTTQSINAIVAAIKSDTSQSSVAGCDSSVLITFFLLIAAVLLGLIFFFPTVLRAVNPFKSGGTKSVTNFIAKPSAPYA